LTKATVPDKEVVESILVAFERNLGKEDNL